MKEKVFEEMNNNVNELIGSKFEIITKYEGLEDKVVDVAKEVKMRLESMSIQINEIKEGYYEFINNKERENESISRELKRMQIINREMISEHKSTNASNREYWNNTQWNPRSKLDKFLWNDNADESFSGKIHKNLSHYSINCGRPIQSAWNKVRPHTNESDYTNVLNSDIDSKRCKNTADASRFKRQTLNFKTLSFDYNNNNSKSTKNHSQPIEKRSTHSLRISTAINNIIEAQK